MSSKQNIVECAYCGREVYEKDTQPAELHADMAWRSLARKHGSRCEWIATRAHRLTPPTEAQIDALRVAAIEAGDYAQADLCDSAYDFDEGNANARALCAIALTYGQDRALV